MRYVKLVFSLAAAAALAGCASHKYDYLYHSKSINPMVSAPGATVKKSQNYYPVPNLPAGGSVRAIPSLVPPDSDLQRFKSKSKSQAQATLPVKKASLANLKQNKDGSSVLVVSENINKAWADVKKALQSTPYKVLDQDSSMASYYILDSVTTGEKITKDTPIYRVTLKSEGAQTNIFLFNKTDQLVRSGVSTRILTALQKKIA